MRKVESLGLFVFEKLQCDMLSDRTGVVDFMSFDEAFASLLNGGQVIDKVDEGDVGESFARGRDSGRGSDAVEIAKCPPLPSLHHA